MLPKHLVKFLVIFAGLTITIPVLILVISFYLPSAKSPTPVSVFDSVTTTGSRESMERRGEEVPVSVEQAIAKAFQSAEPWTVYVNKEGSVAISYPKELFTSSLYSTSLNFDFESKQEREELFKKESDGVCDGLADVGCEKTFVENQKDFQDYIKNPVGLVPYGYESTDIGHAVQTLHGIPFLVWVSLNVNGGAGLNYLGYYNDTKIFFSAFLAQDTFFASNPYSGFYEGSQKILSGKSDDRSIRAQKNAIESIISQIADPRLATPILRQDVSILERNRFESVFPDPCDFKKIAGLHFSDKATTTTVYRNVEKDIELALPYNPLWGFPRYQLRPYDEYGNGVSFGTILVTGEGCGAWIPGTDRITFAPAESQAQVMERLKKEGDALVGDSYSLKAEVVYGKEVVTYQVNALCGGGKVVVIGKQYNYEFTGVCYPGVSEDIIKSMKFISDSN